MRKTFEARTGAFQSEDPWFETRSRAFWDDALTTQQFAMLALPRLPDGAKAAARHFATSHRGLFVVDEADARGAHFVDLWSGAELLIRHVDEAQAIALTHADGVIDARVIAASASGDLFVLPGAFHHPPDAREPIDRIVSAARQRHLSTETVLDALLRMELVLRSSSRVKASFAYRVENLPRR